jgi:hypothetical protein
MDEQVGVAAGSAARFAEHARAVTLEPFRGCVEVGHAQCDVVQTFAALRDVRGDGSEPSSSSMRDSPAVNIAT